LVGNDSVPMGPYPEHSCPRLVRDANVTPASPGSRARASAKSIVAWCQESAARAAASATYFSTGKVKASTSQNVCPSYPLPVSPLAGIGPLLRPHRCLHDVKQGEAHRLLQRGIALELDVRALPQIAEVLTLRLAQPSPTRPLRRGERQVDLLARVGHRLDRGRKPRDARGARCLVPGPSPDRFGSCKPSDFREIECRHETSLVGHDLLPARAETRVLQKRRRSKHKPVTGLTLAAG
jgi:hypothetical protein